MGLEAVIQFFVENPNILFVGLPVCCVLYGISRFFYSKRSITRSPNNPFGEEFIKPRQTLVTDRKRRDAVLKQRFQGHKVPDDLDVVVVGSGVGGLSAAVLLSRVGKKVLVLEQHDVAGGCCHTFVEKGFEFDTGIHYIGEMDGQSWTSVLVEQLTEGQLDWVPMDQEYDVVTIGYPSSKSGMVKRFPMKSGPNEEYWDQLKELFPLNKQDVDKLRALKMKLSKSSFAPYILKFMPLGFATFLVTSGIYNLIFRSYFKYSQQTVHDIINDITNNPDLKAVLSYMIGDYGCSSEFQCPSEVRRVIGSILFNGPTVIFLTVRPSSSRLVGIIPTEAPFTMHLGMIHHYYKGAYYMNGGSSEIPFHMIQNIERFGGRVLVQAPVTNILTSESGEVTGVRVHKSSGVRVHTSSGDVDVFAKMVISDAGLINTFKTLLPREIAVKSPIYPFMEKIGSGTSFMTAFVGLSGTSSELNLKAAHTWAFLSNDVSGILGDYMSLSVDDLESAEIPLIFISFPSAKDPSWEERYPGKSSALLISYANWDWFSQWKDDKVRHRADRYEQIKMAIGKQMWKQCCELFPQLDGKLEYLEVGSPLSNSYYLGSPKGEAYGLNHTKERFTLESCLHLRPETGIPGLFLTGQDACISGMVGAMMGAVTCVSKIQDRNVFNDLLKLHKTLKKKPDRKANITRKAASEL